MSAIQSALARLRRARSIDEGDEAAAELARAAASQFDEVIDLYRATQGDAFALVWCLQGRTEERVIDLFLSAFKHHDAQVRWAAIEGLKHSRRPSLIPVFINALKDRSHLVKLVAVEWLKSNGDARALGPLERIISLPSMARTSPGIVRTAREAIDRLNDTGVG